LIKLEMDDGSVTFLNLDLVYMVRNHQDGGLAVRYKGKDGEMAGMRCKRFQIIKQGTWYT